MVSSAVDGFPGVYGRSLPCDIRVFIYNDVCVVNVRMDNCPGTVIVLGDNILVNHRSLDKIINHHRGLFLA